jgi:endo-1,4-beta-xylanase
LNRPLHFSEITVLSDDPEADHSKAWPTTPEGEQRQAEYVEKLYTLLFSHPAVQAIAWWNFVDGDWDRNPGGLLRADLTPKPAYERLQKLIKERWWTQEDLRTDSKGTVKLRGFRGRYRIRVRTSQGEATQEADVRQGRKNQFKVQLQ